MGTWAVVAWLVALAVTVGVLAWLVHLAAKLRAYVLQAGDATRLLQAASQRALAEFPAEPADGKRKAPDAVEIVEQAKREHNIRGAGEPSAAELWARDAADERGPGAKE